MSPRHQAPRHQAAPGTPTQLRKGALELAVLALLSRQPSYGFQIVEQLGDHAGLQASTGTIYPLLTRLKNAGLVETTWHESTQGPPRKYYRLSPDGERHLAEQARAWQELVATMAALLTEPEETP